MISLDLHKRLLLHLAIMSEVRRMIIDIKVSEDPQACGQLELRIKEYLDLMYELEGWRKPA